VTLSPLRRKLLLGLALLATVAAAVVPAEPEEVAVPVKGAVAARTAPPGGDAREGREVSTPRGGRSDNASAGTLPSLPLERLDVKGSREAVSDAFEVRSWAPPPPPPPKPVPPPPPQAPPLPFKYMGKIMEAGQVVVFLERQDRNFVVRAGDKLDNNYQVDEIKPGVMTLTYLPLGQKQTLAIGAAN